LHRSDHRQINLERETKWISSKPKQNGAETKPITYNNKKKTTDLLTTTNKTIDCLQQKTKLPIAYIDKKQNYWLLAITATTKTSIAGLNKIGKNYWILAAAAKTRRITCENKRRQQPEKQEKKRKKESSRVLAAAEERRASTSSAFYWLCSLEAKPRERLNEQCFFFPGNLLSRSTYSVDWWGFRV
jgi:hypothetical protein